MEKKNEEIDLLDILLRLINILRANFWLITAFFLIGIALGLFSYFKARKVFVNKMVVSSSILTKTYGKILLDKVNRHLSEKNTAVVARDLQLSPEALKGISRLEIEDLTESEASKESDRFIITAETYNQELLPDLQKGLLHYLQNNEFVKIRVDQNKDYLQQMLSKTEQEIKDMEDFKMRLFKGDFFESSRGNVMFDPTVVNSKILELTKEKINLQNAFVLANSVQVIEGFTPFQKPSKPRLSYSLLIGAFVGLFLVGLIIAFKSIRKLLRMADRAKENA